MKTGDRWESVETFGRGWRFHAGHSDQGLMYYFAKYAVQDVTIIIGKRIQHWVPGDASNRNQPIMQSEQPATELFTELQNQRGDQARRLNPFCSIKYVCTEFPYRDYIHFAGDMKPWDVKRRGPAARHWFEQLEELNQKLSLNLDVPNLKFEDPPLGRIALYTEHQKIVQHEKEESHC